MNAFLIVLAIAAAPHGHKKTIHVEAESGKLTGITVATTRTGFSGKGYVTGFSKPTDKVALRFKATAGIFEATIHYSAPNGDKGYQMRLNGVASTSSFPAPATRAKPPPIARAFQRASTSHAALAP